MDQKSKRLVDVTLAAAVYILWAFLLFGTHRGALSSYKILYAIHPPLAAMGVFLLSRRWLSDWMPSIMAGLLYGFGPFGISFLGFHPIAGLTFSAAPWLLLPSVYWRQGQTPNAGRLAIRAALCVLPFAFIIGFFWVFSQHWAGPIFLLPGKTILHWRDFGGFVLPLSMAGRPVIIGLYHAGLMAAMMGLLVYLSAQRVLVLAVPAIGLVMAFLDPVLGVSPIIWAALPMVFCAILAGLGLQALLFAGKSDAKWVLTCLIGGVLCAVVSTAIYLPNRTGATLSPVLFYTAVTIGLGGIFLLARLGARVLLLRWLILAAITAADCWLSGQWLVDRLI